MNVSKKHKTQLVSLIANDKEVRNLARKNYKYLYSVQQFGPDKLPQHELVSLFFNHISKAKLLYTFKLNWACNTRSASKRERVIAVYKKHGKSLSKVDVNLSKGPQHYLFPKFFMLLWNIRDITLIDRPHDLKIVPILQKLETLTIHMMEKLENLEEFAKSVARTHGPRTVRLVLSSSCLLNMPTTVNDALSQLVPKIKGIEFFLYANTEYVPLDDFLKITKHKVTSVNFLSNFSRNLLPDFLKKYQYLDNLQSLSLQLKEGSEDLIPSLESLESCHKLKILDVKLSLKPASSLIEKIFQFVKFPKSLVAFKLDMPLVLGPLIVKNKQILATFLKEYTIDDSVNLFEDEVSFSNLFKTFESAKNMKYVDLAFRIGELFIAPYTNFFSSILKRIPNVETLKLLTHEDEDLVVDPECEAEERGENCFNLALFFDCCPNLQKLKILDISMPNYYFGYLNLLNKFPKLNKFVLNNQETLFFEKLSQQLDRLIKSLSLNTLEAIDFGFTETLSMSSLVKRIALFKKFKQLRYFSARYKVAKIEAGGSKALGIAFQSIKTLQFLYVAFENDERDFADFKRYMKYDNTIKEAYFCFAIPE